MRARLDLNIIKLYVSVARCARCVDVGRITHVSTGTAPNLAVSINNGGRDRT